MAEPLAVVIDEVPNSSFPGSTVVTVICPLCPQVPRTRGGRRVMVYVAHSHGAVAGEPIGTRHGHCQDYLGMYRVVRGDEPDLWIGYR